MHEVCEAFAKRINELKADIAKNVVEIGDNLIRARAELPQSEFSGWLATAVHFSRRQAYNLIAVAEKYGHKPELINELGQSKVIALIQAIPDDEARDKYVEEHPVKEMSVRELKKDIEKEVVQTSAQPTLQERLDAEVEREVAENTNLGCFLKLARRFFEKRCLTAEKAGTLGGLADAERDALLDFLTEVQAWLNRVRQANALY